MNVEEQDLMAAKTMSLWWKVWRQDHKTHRFQKIFEEVQVIDPSIIRLAGVNRGIKSLSPGSTGSCQNDIYLSVEEQKWWQLEQTSGFLSNGFSTVLLSQERMKLTKRKEIPGTDYQ